MQTSLRSVVVPAWPATMRLQKYVLKTNGNKTVLSLEKFGISPEDTIPKEKMLLPGMGLTVVLIPFPIEF